MKRRAENAWLKRLGKHIEQLIQKKGYESPYEFWLEKVGDEMSRTTLNYVLTGKFDSKVSTLKKLADNLGVSLSELVNFEKK